MHNIYLTVNVFPRLDTEDAIAVFIDRETLVDAIPMGHSLTYLFDASKLPRDSNGKLNDSLIINLDVHHFVIVRCLKGTLISTSIVIQNQTS